jgi:hypothetical protein
MRRKERRGPGTLTVAGETEDGLEPSTDCVVAGLSDEESEARL